MQKIQAVLLAALLLCAAGGCARQTESTPSPTPPAAAETPVPTEPVVRKDVLGNLIQTSYAEGTFSEIVDGKLIVEENGKTRVFLLTERAARDVTSLGIEKGMRVIINYNVLEDGGEEAESVEKIILE